MDKDSLFEKIMPIVDRLSLIRLSMDKPLRREIWVELDKRWDMLSNELVNIIVSENMASVAHKVATKPH